MTRRAIYKNCTGMTLIEMVIMMGVVGILMLSIVTLTRSTEENVKKFDRLFLATLDSTTGEMQIFQDINEAFPSFNNLLTLDKDGKGFFDYFSDVSPKTIVDEEKTRSIILGLGPGEKTEITLLVRKSQPVIYDPVMAYDVIDPTTFGEAGTLIYKKLDNRITVSGAQFKYISDPTRGLLPIEWRLNELMLLFCPVSVRPQGPGGVVDLKKPSKWLIFLGEVAAGDDLQHNDFEGLIRTTHPAQPSQEVLSADTFLRTLPPAGGAAPPIFLMPVALIKYTIETRVRNSKETYNVIIRRVYRNGAFEPLGQLILSEVVRLEFTRSSVLIPAINVAIKRENHI